MWEISLQVPISALRQTQTSAKFATSTTTQHKNGAHDGGGGGDDEGDCGDWDENGSVDNDGGHGHGDDHEKNLIIMMMKGS